jgi:hypothetical protein
MISYSPLKLDHSFNENFFSNEINNAFDGDSLVMKNGICTPKLCTLKDVVLYVRHLIENMDLIILNTSCHVKHEVTFGFLDFAVL